MSCNGRIRLNRKNTVGISTSGAMPGCICHVWMREELVVKKQKKGGKWKEGKKAKEISHFNQAKNGLM